MKKINIKGLLLIGLFAIVSCQPSNEVNSVITSFPVMSPALDPSTPPVVVSEAVGGTYTFNFKLSAEDQVNPFTALVEVGSSSTATEGVDFILNTHEVDLLAFQGQDGFDVEIEVLEDYEAENGDETVYLTFTSQSPSGIDKSETLAVTIQDSGETVHPPSDVVNLTLRWEFDDPNLGMLDVCDIINDYDLVIYDATGSPYDPDLTGYSLASIACPEMGGFNVSDMVDGEVYYLWYIAWGGVDYGSNGALTIYLDYSREYSTFNGTYALSGVFDSSDAGVAAIPLIIYRTGDVLTMEDPGGVVGEGRIDGEGSSLPKYKVDREKP